MAKQNPDTESPEPRHDDAGSSPTSNEERFRGTPDGSIAEDSESDFEDADDLDEEDDDSEDGF